MIFQIVDKRTEIQSITTSHTAHLCSYYNQVFALLISMPRYTGITFFLIGLRLSHFCQKNTKFSSAGGSATRPRHNFPNADFQLRTSLLLKSSKAKVCHPIPIRHKLVTNNICRSYPDSGGNWRTHTSARRTA